VLLASALLVASGQVGWGQEAAVQGYVEASSVGPGWLILATPESHWSIQLGDG
jgi:hypothetical protein